MDSVFQGGTYQETFDRDIEKYLQSIEDYITKSITKPVLEFIQKLFEKYGQVRQTTPNKHEQRLKSILYTLTEPLRTVFTQV